MCVALRLIDPTDRVICLDVQAIGTSVVCKGTVVEPPEGAKQIIEVNVTEVIFVGECDPTKYPISKGYMTLEKLREHMTFRRYVGTLFHDFVSC